MKIYKYVEMYVEKCLYENIKHKRVYNNRKYKNMYNL